MNVPSLPWIVGPIPIVITVFSAYLCGKMLARRQVTSGVTIAAELFLCTGFLALIVYLLSDMDHLKISIFATEVMSAILSVSFALFANKFGYGIPDFPKQHEPQEKSVLQVCIYLSSFFFLNVIIYIFPFSDKCTSPKCNVAELLFGSVSHSFAWDYLLGFLGSLTLIGVIGGIIQALKAE